MFHVWWLDVLLHELFIYNPTTIILFSYLQKYHNTSITIDLFTKTFEANWYFFKSKWKVHEPNWMTSYFTIINVDIVANLCMKIHWCYMKPLLLEPMCDTLNYTKSWLPKSTTPHPSNTGWPKPETRAKGNLSHFNRFKFLTKIPS